MKLHYKITRFTDIFQYDIPHFLKNVWKFRKALWNFRAWDSTYNLMLFRTSLEHTRESIAMGHEEVVSRNKKLAKIDRAIELMKLFEEDDFIGMAEKELGEINSDFELVGRELKFKSTPEDDAHARKVFLRTQELENEHWEELWKIIHGQSQDKMKHYTQEEYDTMYDGSGMLGWWD